MYCYLLESTDKRRTYIGATLDVDRRLDQHNRVHTGGAKATAGRSWRRVCYVSGFTSWTDTLSFEWAWKYYSKQKGVAGRIHSLLYLLQQEQSTSKAMPFHLWSHNFRLHISTWAVPEVKKIDTWPRLKSMLPVSSVHPSFQLFQLPFLVKMSSVSVVDFQALKVLVDTLSADVLSLNERLSKALSDAPVAEKKERKTKAAKPAENVIVNDEKKPRKKREVKPKAECPTATEGTIRFASCAATEKNEYKVFNNMFKKTFIIDGKEYPCVTHYLAWAKYATTDAEYAEKMLAQKNPALLTGMLKSKDHKAREDWDTASTPLMWAALKAKFADADLRALLLKTDKAKIEYESATDAILGIGADGKGLNLLGDALQTLRKELKA